MTDEPKGPPPDPQRMADSHHVKRDPETDEISWPPSSLEEVLKEAKLI